MSRTIKRMYLSDNIFDHVKTCKSWSIIRRITYVEKRMEKFDVRFSFINTKIF